MVTLLHRYVGEEMVKALKQTKCVINLKIGDDKPMYKISKEDAYFQIVQYPLNNVVMDLYSNGQLYIRIEVPKTLF